MGVKQCELCDRAARIHCESDQASLCWECDARVHGANFLVARHTRCLLCRSCQAPTPWRAEGARLGPTVSVCVRCAATASSSAEGKDFAGVREVEEEDGGMDGDEDGEEEDEEDEEEEEEEDEDGDEEDEEDEGENQVVPWSLTPPPVASSSSSEGEEESSRRGSGGGLLKRTRENADLAASQDDLACSSSRASYLSSAPAPSPASPATMAASAAEDDEASSFAAAFRPSKDRKRPALLRPAPAPPATDTAMLDVRVHGHRRAVGLMTHPNRYKNVEG